MSASLLLKHPAGFIPLKANNKNAEWDDYGLHKKEKSSKDKSIDDLSFGLLALTSAKPDAVKTFSYKKPIGLLLVVAAHAGLLYFMMNRNSLPPVIQQPATPITVSIIAPPSPEPVPEPEVVPIIKPVKVAKKAVIKPKKVVEKIVPVAEPERTMVEATTEPVVEEQQQEVEAAPVVEQKAAAKAAPVEEIIEQPKFGVAYLNNPAPNYPRLSRRMGEEGRVLLKVLVSAEGKADSVTIEKSSGSTRLDDSALEAVKRWRFIPARKGKEALSAYVLVPINFSLDG